MDWKIENGLLRTTLRFKSQRELVEFLLEVAKLADARDHHPDITVRKAFQLTLELMTHSEGKITEKDHELAAAIEGLLQDH